MIPALIKTLQTMKGVNDVHLNKIIIRRVFNEKSKYQANFPLSQHPAALNISSISMLMRRETMCVSEILSVYLSTSSTYLAFNGHRLRKIKFNQSCIDVIAAQIK